MRYATLVAMLLLCSHGFVDAARMLLATKFVKTAPFNRLEVARDADLPLRAAPSKPNLKIRPSPGSSKAPWKRSTKTTLKYNGKEALSVVNTKQQTDELFIPRTLPYDMDFVFDGNNRVSFGDTDNKNNGVCKRKFKLIGKRKVSFHTRGKSVVRVDCVNAGVGTALEFKVQGDSITLSKDSVNVDKVVINAVQGTNRMKVDGEDETRNKVKRIVIMVVQGELMLDVKKPSTQFQWNLKSEFGGELWIKTAGGPSKCPYFTNDPKKDNYKGPPIGCSRYCCGDKVDLGKKICPPGSVKAGNWDSTCP